MSSGMDGFQRDITYRTGMRGDAVLLTATMRDRFHDLTLEVEVDAAQLVVRSARAEFKKCPTQDCHLMSERIQALAGLAIAPGMNRKLQVLFGGGEGCGNVRTLLSGLLPLAMNARAAAGLSTDEETLEMIHRHLVGTCVGYKSPPQAK